VNPVDPMDDLDYAAETLRTVIGQALRTADAEGAREFVDKLHDVPEHILAMKRELTPPAEPADEDDEQQAQTAADLSLPGLVTATFAAAEAPPSLSVRAAIDQLSREVRRRYHTEPAAKPGAAEETSFTEGSLWRDIN